MPSLYNFINTSQEKKLGESIGESTSQRLSISSSIISSCTWGYANMIVCSPIRNCMKNVVHISRSTQRQMNNQICGVLPQSSSGASCFHLSLGRIKPNYVDMSVVRTNSNSSLFASDVGKNKSNWHLNTVRSVVCYRCLRKTCLKVSLGSQYMNIRLPVSKQGIINRMKSSLEPVSWLQGCASAGLILGLLVCYSTSQPVHAEAALAKEKREGGCNYSKQVHTDYSVIGIPGDGRCLFRAVAHGACLRSGKPAPNESLQRQLADELRARVADEFVKRREETEWFIEGNFDTYVSQMRKAHVWGGEPELLMASHVLKMPITVYMNDEDSGGLISIAEYGQEYGKEDSIRVLYHGFGHYDALRIPGKKDGKSRL